MSSRMTSWTLTVLSAVVRFHAIVLRVAYISSVMATVIIFGRGDLFSVFFAGRAIFFFYLCLCNYDNANISKFF